MIVPDEHHPGWINAISGEKKPNYDLLATKILIGRLTLTYKIDPSPQTIKKSIAELRTFFERNIDLPKAQADLKKIFDEAVTK